MKLRDQLQASLGDAFILERELAGGGMSRVFVAEEVALRRRVVVKVVPPEAAAQVSIDRFKKEITFAARLQHPHIVPLLTAGDAAGLPYFTMPFVEGESLAARVKSRGELPVGDAIRILREIATALDFAHEHGIVHRDIKPENVLLAGSAGIAMVADFGVAKALNASSGLQEWKPTTAGVSLGTPAYMSPEQAAADPTIDHRADIYSFGVLAYELLTGSPPFVRRSMQQLLAAQVSEPPIAVMQLRPSLPVALASLVMRCLEKRPADRPQSAAVIVHALDDLTMATGDGHRGAPWAKGVRDRARASPTAWLLGAAIVVSVSSLGILALARRANRAEVTTSVPLASIAVLPFENRSGDSTLDYFAEGMSDELRSDLTRLPGLAVKGASSSRQFGARAVDVRKAGEELGARTIVTGTVNRSSGRVHVTAELVKVATNDALWSGTFDAKVSDLAALQDSLTHAIAGELKVSLARGTDATRSNALRGTSDVDAYDEYLQGRYAEHRHEYQRAAALYGAAVARDPRFPQPFAGMAFALAAQAQTGVGSRDSALAAARRAATKAARLGPDLPEVYRARITLAVLAGDFRAADQLSEKLLAAYPGDAESHEPRTLTLGLTGRPEEAVAEGRKAEVLDPLDPRTFMSLGYRQYGAGDLPGSIATVRRVLELGPSRASAALAYQTIGLAEAFAGFSDSAAATFETAMRTDSTVYGMRAYLMFGYAAAGRWKEARVQRALIEREAATGNSPHFLRVLVHETFGQRDSAMADLRKSVQANEPLYTFTDVSCDPLFDALKTDRRFSALMASKGATVCPVRWKWPVGKPR
jgi:serine/threonine-protein kinase